MGHIDTRFNQKGEIRYRARVRIKGCAVQSSTFSDKHTAELWIKQIEDAQRLSKQFDLNSVYPFSEVVKRYINEQIPTLSPTEQRKRISQLEFWNNHFGNTILSAITPEMIEKILNELSKTITIRKKRPISANTMQRRVAALSHVFTVAMLKWKIIRDNPCRFVQKPASKQLRMSKFNDSKDVYKFFKNADGSFNLSYIELNEKDIEQLIKDLEKKLGRILIKD